MIRPALLHSRDAVDRMKTILSTLEQIAARVDKDRQPKVEKLVSFSVRTFGQQEEPPCKQEERPHGNTL